MNLTRLRHDLHRHPEIGLRLPRTQRVVLDALAGLPVEVGTGRELSSVVAVLRGGARTGGPVVLLRADLDALPVTETADVPYKSTVDGSMHACGHDLHTAMLVGAAHRLAARADELAGDVLFCFQPGEEGHGGARTMLAEGLLTAAGRRPVACYALHVFGDVVPHGVVATRPGPIMAASDGMRVTVRGRGGHASTPHRTRDPIPPACEMVTATQALVARGFDVFEPVVVTVGTIHAGTRRNVIPATAELELSIRSFSAESRRTVLDRLTRLYQGIAAAHDLTVTVEPVPVHPPTVNDAAATQLALDTATDLFGPDRAHTMPHPLAASEDFAYLLDAVPGAFVLLGAAPAGTAPADSASNHAGDVVFADDVLDDGADLLTELALRRLAQG
ncbi:M20 family metallopeptidase [Actinocatenispora sera]|uniref:M20 metallopeptidase family protein n=1 Tax=Actinocatenispora sera TaxID=390989 RepID=UPI0033DEC5D3